MGDGEAHRRFWLKSLRERGQFENKGVYGRKILMDLEEVEMGGGGGGVGFVSPSIGGGGGGV